MMPASASWLLLDLQPATWAACNLSNYCTLGLSSATGVTVTRPLASVVVASSNLIPNNTMHGA
jgi:hypothetical protein